MDEASKPTDASSGTEDLFGIVGTTQAGNLAVEKPIAEGGFGVVYRAYHGAFRAPVALKCLKVPGTLTPDQRTDFLEKFRSEAELLFRLSASIPEVVRPLNVDQLKLPDGRFVPFIALEWLEGEALSSIIERRRAMGKAPIKLPKLLTLLAPIAQALAKAHCFPTDLGEVAIIHRDLKPENIFVSIVDGRERVRILDYGIAKARASASSQAGRATADTVHVFTPAYAAPEQWVPKRFGQTGSWTDVWGLAITMVEAIVGRPPIDGEFHTMLATAIDEARRPSPRTFGVEVSDHVESVFQHALAVDPRERVHHIEDFWTALEDAMGVPHSFVKKNEPLVRALSSFPVRGAKPGPAPDPVSIGTPKLPAGFTNLELDIPVKVPPSAAAKSPQVLALESASASPGGPAAKKPLVTPLPLPSGPLDDFDDDEISSFEIDDGMGGGMPMQAPVSSRKRLARHTGSMGRDGTMARSGPRVSAQTYWDRLAGPMRLLGVALLVTMVDMALRTFANIELSWGPATAAWVAGPLAAYAIILAVWRFFSD